jgi:hypothetical protein
MTRRSNCCATFCADETRVHVRLANLFNRNVHRNAHARRQLFTKHFDVLALLTNDNAGPRCMNRYSRCLRRTLDDHATDRRRIQTLQDVRTHFKIGDQL